MMSTADKVVPFKGALATHKIPSTCDVTSLPGLTSAATRALEDSYPGVLTKEMRELLQESSGLAVHGFGHIDFTGHHYPEEPISVLRPCLTLAIDDTGRRWIAETSQRDGLPGAVWCVVPDPAVAVQVSDDVATFIDELKNSVRRRSFAAWLRGVDLEAHRVWANRHKLARQSYELCQSDRSISGWLSELPLDAQIYDLRSSMTARGWPYGVAGADGRFYRCGRLPVFAVARAPRATRWQHYMARVAAQGQVSWPAAAALAA